MVVGTSESGRVSLFERGAMEPVLEVESCFMWCYKVFEFIDSSAKNINLTVY